MTPAATILVLYLIQGLLGHGLPQSPLVGIAHGHAVNITDAPFMAAVLYVDSYTLLCCGGSIIHKYFVLTAASCRKEDTSITVRVGSTRFDEGGELHPVEKYITHDSYSDETWYLYNVALLKLSKPVTLGPSVAAITLADHSVNIPAGLTANVTGWGETKNTYVSRNLQQVSVTVSPHDDCIDYFDYYGRKLTDKQFCVNNQDIGACNKDEGGPLVVGDLQIGFLSYGYACWTTPSVYEKVAPYLQWIRNKIKQNL